jgi:PPOX class probable F420-dependent enzyme
MRPMSDAEQRAFLDVPQRTATLATVRSDGRPHAAPIWFVAADGLLWFTTWHDTVKARNLARDPRVVLSIDDPAFPFAFVIVEGDIEVVDDPELLRAIATRIAARYVPADQVEAYGERNSVAGELLIRVTPTKIITATGIAD